MPEHLPHTNCTQRETATPLTSSCCCCCWRATSYYNSNLCSLQTLFTRTFLSTPYDWVRDISSLSHPVLPPPSGAKETCFCHSPLKLASCRMKEAEMKPNGTSKTNLQNENATHTRNEREKERKGDSKQLERDGRRKTAAAVASTATTAASPRYSFGDLPVTGLQRAPFALLNPLLLRLPGSPSQLTLTRQIALLSPSMLVLFIAFLTLFWLICFRCRFFLFAALLRLLSP